MNIASIINFRMILLITLFSACNPLGLPSDSPKCIEDIIRQIEREPVRNPPASVYEYRYQGQKVYYVPPYCCDMFGDVFDTNCNMICHPDGGITGEGDSKCPDFFEEATNGKLIWEDDRE